MAYSTEEACVSGLGVACYGPKDRFTHRIRATCSLATPSQLYLGQSPRHFEYRSANFCLPRVKRSVQVKAKYICLEWRPTQIFQNHIRGWTGPGTSVLSWTTEEETAEICLRCRKPCQSCLCEVPFRFGNWSDQNSNTSVGYSKNKEKRCSGRELDLSKIRL